MIIETDGPASSKVIHVCLESCAKFCLHICNHGIP